MTDHSETSGSGAPPSIISLEEWLTTAKCFKFEFYRELGEDIEFALKNNEPICSDCYRNQRNAFIPDRHNRQNTLDSHLHHRRHELRINSPGPSTICSLCFVIIDQARPLVACTDCTNRFDRVVEKISSLKEVPYDDWINVIITRAVSYC